MHRQEADDRHTLAVVGMGEGSEAIVIPRRHLGTPPRFLGRRFPPRRLDEGRNGATALRAGEVHGAPDPVLQGLAVETGR